MYYFLLYIFLSYLFFTHCDKTTRLKPVTVRARAAAELSVSSTRLSKVSPARVTLNLHVGGKRTNIRQNSVKLRRVTVGDFSPHYYG